ncbi:MAG: aminotransferase class I/II-fold pyridoxal phosphate-dependent enzyme, partial [Candidatus Micrarchaeaceae archaeon]
RSIASISNEAKDCTITINGLSKSHSMTGYRIGYAAGSENLANAMARIQSHTTSSISSITQYAAIEALRDNRGIAAMRSTFKRRRDIIVKGFSKMQGISMVKPGGAFYAFPNISETAFARQRKQSKSLSDSFAEQLLEKEKVAVIPGISFGSDKHVRISYAVNDNTIKEGMERISRFLS